MALSILQRYNWAADQTTGGAAGTIDGGTIVTRRNGPIISGNGADGMSPRFFINGAGNQNYQWTGFTDTDGTIRVIDVMLRAEWMYTGNPAHIMYFCDGDRFACGVAMNAGFTSTEMFVGFYSGGAGANTALPSYANTPYEWINFRIVTRKISAGVYDVETMCRPSLQAGGPGGWTTIHSLTSYNMGGGNTMARFGMSTFGAYATQQFKGRVFGSVASAAAWSERYDDLPGQTWPSNSTTWYFDPVGGNDSGDGSSSAPWMTLDKLMDEDAKTFQAPAVANRWVYTATGLPYDWTAYSLKVTGDLYWAGKIRSAGDRVIIAYNNGLEIAVNRTLSFSTPGLRIGGPAFDQLPKLSHAQAIPASAWSVYSGNIYQATLSANRFAWQNRRAMSPVFGANISAAAISMTPGTFYIDATKMYVRAFNDINLATAPNGTIETSLVDGTGVTLLNLAGRTNTNVLPIRRDGDQVAEFMDLGYTTLRTMNSPGEAVGGYPIGADGHGLNIIFRNKVHDGGKHLVGILIDRLNSGIIIMDNEFTGCSPTGGHTVDVDYCSQVTANTFVNNRAYRRGNRTIANAITAGTGKYHRDEQESQYICHSNGGGTASTHSSLIFQDEDYTGAGPSLDIQQDVAELLANDCKFTVMNARSNMVFNRCTFNRQGPMVGIYNNCLLTCQPRTSDASVAQAQLSTTNTCVLNRCVLDMNCTGVAMLFAVSNGFTMTFTNCTIMLPAGIALLSGATNASTISFRGCRWVLGGGASQNLFLSYNDGSTTANRTLANLQTLGIDVGGTLVTPQSASVADEMERWHERAPSLIGGGLMRTVAA